MDITYNQMVLELLDQTIWSGTGKKMDSDDNNLWREEVLALNEKDKVLSSIEVKKYFSELEKNPLVFGYLGDSDPPVYVNGDFSIRLEVGDIYKILAIWRHKSLEEAREYYWNLKRWSYENISNQKYQKYIVQMIGNLMQSGVAFLNNNEVYKERIKLVRLYKLEIESLLSRDSVLTHLETQNLYEPPSHTFTDMRLFQNTLLYWRMEGFQQACDYYHNTTVRKFGVKFIDLKD